VVEVKAFPAFHPLSVGRLGWHIALIPSLTLYAQVVSGGATYQHPTFGMTMQGLHYWNVDNTLVWRKHNNIIE